MSRYGMTKDGRCIEAMDLNLANSMTSPVRCAHCGRIYDLGTVTVTGHYIDCSLWTTPCCGRQVDDRGETGWKSTKDYKPVTTERVWLDDFTYEDN